MHSYGLACRPVLSTITMYTYLRLLLLPIWVFSYKISLQYYIKRYRYPTIRFSMEREIDTKLSFLDILLDNSHPSLLVYIARSRLLVFLLLIIIKFPYNVRFDWLKQRTLSENKVQVNDIKLAFKFLLRNFDKFDPN